MIRSSGNIHENHLDLAWIWGSGVKKDFPKTGYLLAILIFLNGCISVSKVSRYTIQSSVEELV